jgi:pimeloyl-ACP methyl ester carboxylesterase
MDPFAALLEAKMTMAPEIKPGEIARAGTKLRYPEAGKGETVLFLHGASGAAWTPLLGLLSAECRVIAPEHPGFGRSQIPDWMMSAGDVAFFYLDLLRALDLRDVHLVGHCVGGWIAAEIAIRSTGRIKSLTLLAPAGVVVPEAPVGDIFMWSWEEFDRLQFHDQAAWERWSRANPERDIDVMLQNRAALARIAWTPRLSNPQLAFWLHRINVPTLLVWGKEDRVIPFASHAPYLREIPGLSFHALEDTGHALPIERPHEVAERLSAFLQQAKASGARP